MGKLLVVVDMQNDFVEAEGVLSTPEAQMIIPNVLRKIRIHTSTVGNDVIFTKDTHDSNYLNTQEGKNLPIPHCIRGTWGHQLIEELTEFEDIGYEVIEKTTFGYANWNKNKLQYDEIELIGVCTDICVITNAIMLKTLMPEVKITVDGRCCAGVTSGSHKTALDAMEALQIVVKR